MELTRNVVKMCCRVKKRMVLLVCDYVTTEILNYYVVRLQFR